MNRKIKLFVGMTLGVATLFGLFVIANPALAMTCNSATLTGTVETGTPPTHARFSYGTNYSTVANGGGTTTAVQYFYNEGTYPIQQFISGLSESTTYYFRLEVTNNYGTENLNINSFTTPACEVSNPAPTVTVTADNRNLPYNGSTTIRWTSNADSCTASGGSGVWSSASYNGNPSHSNISGSSPTGNLTNAVTYSMRCTNSDGQQAIDSETVNVDQPVARCTDVNANNYNSIGSCTYTRCTDAAANNYNSIGSCTYTRCTDINATNYNGIGSCNYAARCTDINANNYNSIGSCTYNRCTDINATNYNGIGSCRYFTPLTTCQDTNAINYGGALPCRYFTPITTCQDPSANNFGGTLPCRYTTGQRPIVILTADDTSIDRNDNTTIRWSVSNNADTCIASGGTSGWAGNQSRTGGTFNTGNMTSDRTFSITCTNNFGSDNDSVPITVDDDDGDGPTVSIRADENTVDYNDSTTIRWSSSNADSCRASGGTNGWSGSKSRSGTFPTRNLTEDTTYRIICENDDGDDTDSVTVRVTDNNIVQTCQDSNAINYRGTVPCRYNTVVNNQPTVVLYADSTNIAYNSATTVRWGTANATSCIAYGGSIGWAGPKSIGPGSFYTGSLTSSQTYTITCSNNVGSATDSVTVNVRGQVLGASTAVVARPAPTSLVLITSSVDRNQPIVPTLDNTNPCPGDEINYTVTYQNIGTASITNLTLRIDLPYEVDYMFSNPNNPMRSGNTLIFTLGTLRANGQGTVTIRVRVRDNIPSGTNLNFPATLSYTDPSGSPQSVNANVSAQVCGVLPAVIIQDDNGKVLLGANVFGAGFLPGNIFGWLLLFILILLLVLLAKRIFDQPFHQRTMTTYDPIPAPQPLGRKTTTTTIESHS